MKAVGPVIDSYGVPYHQMRPIGSQSMSEREKEGKKYRSRDKIVLYCIVLYFIDGVVLAVLMHCDLFEIYFALRI